MTSSGAPPRVSLASKTETPFISRAELLEDQRAHPPYGTHFREPLDAYVRVTTTREGLRWLDTAASLNAKAQRWQAALREVAATDRVLWALDDPPQLDALAIPVAGYTHARRLHELIDQSVTVVVCTPSDALRLADNARDVDLAERTVRLVVVTGEPGGSVPSTRRRIEELFGARCLDVYAMTETGPLGWQCAASTDGVHLETADFACEIDRGELVVNSKAGSPLVGYRTGDLVQRAGEPCACGREVVCVLGRADEALRVRGVVILPSMLENIVRRHPAVTEYRLDAYHVRGESELGIEIEPDEAVATEGDRARVAAEVAEDIKRSLGLRLQCEAVPPASLPRDDPRPRRVIRRS
jgi:phenylacetate-CoA ligase